jgi:hypothetical protein
MVEIDVAVQLMYRDVVSNLKDAVDKFIIDNPTVDLSNAWILAPSGWSVNLGSITVPSVATFAGFKINVGSLNVKIPTADIKYVGIGNPNLLLLGLTMNMRIPGSEHWYYGGPLRGNVWPPQVGTSFATTQYYTGEDGLIDGAFVALVFAIVYGLSKLGLTSLASDFVKRILSRNTLSASNETIHILENTQEILDGLNDVNTTIGDIEDGTVSDPLHKVAGVTNGLAQAMKLIIDKVDVQVLTSEENEYVQTELSDLADKLDEIKMLIKQNSRRYV